ncbi:putative nictotinate phosphoribosyltransferase [Pectobacterium phage DU_PP_IV]|nr:putative nictotinate phosphoribosyltransferase [Pectobacterium phage DU_PP_IV]
MKNLTLDQKRLVAEKIFLSDYITKKFPKGFVSYVADSYSYWDVLTKLVPSLKDEIMARDGRVVFRPDSGVPEDIICGTLDWRKVEDFDEAGTLERAAEWALESAVEEVRQNTPHGERGNDIVERFFLFDGDLYRMSGTIEWDCDEYTYYYVDGSKVTAIDKPELTNEQKGSVELLYDVFGGDLNSKGYRTLDTHVGLIYGDSITVARAKEIFERLEAKGFASNNVVFGVGSFTTQFNTRDSLGQAVKATGAVIDGQQIMVVKEPKTDLGKKSAQGFLKVVRGEDGELKLVDNLQLEQVNDADNELRVVFRDGKLLVDETLTEIRERVTANLK